jgi:hypothetical protein
MNKGFRRLYSSLHRTDRKRSARQHELAPSQLMSEIPGWRKCTTIKPMEELNVPTRNAA